MLSGCVDRISEANISLKICHNMGCLSDVCCFVEDSELNAF